MVALIFNTLKNWERGEEPVNPQCVSHSTAGEPGLTYNHTCPAMPPAAPEPSVERLPFVNFGVKP